MSQVDPTEVTRVVTELLGFRPEPTRMDDAIRAVGERLRRRACADVAEYQALLDDPVSRSVEARALADRLTINETYFFREDAHNKVLRDVVLTRHREYGHPPLRILSLGCSSGEEPYGAALTLSEAGLTRNEVRITAIDASAAAIDKAERARFSAWSLRNVDDVRRRRYFLASGSGFELASEVRSWVRFAVSNLVDRDPGIFERETYDVVFCRNVLIYFTADVIRAVIDDIFQTLRPGGFLFLGHAETGHAGRRFQPHEANGAFYFTKRSASEFPTLKLGRGNPVTTDATPTQRPGSIFEPAVTPRVNPVAVAADEPERDSRRPTERAPSIFDPQSTGRPARPAGEWFDDCASAMRAERFDEALAILDAAPEGRDRNLVRASILTNRGALADARAACAAVMADGPKDAEVHYLLGLCAELDRRPDTARDEYLRAAMLDEDFAMPRLRLGMLARRGRQLVDAKRYLGDALRLFPYQTERVLLLFGGGFHVDGLTRLCRTEIDACKKTS